MWYADIYTDSADLYYSNDDELYNFALQAGWITQEEYNKEMADLGRESRTDFVKQLNLPYITVYEEIEAADITQNKYMYAGLIISDKFDSFFEANGVMIAECYWVGHEIEPPITTPKRLIPRGRKAPQNFPWFK